MESREEVFEAKERGEMADQRAVMRQGIYFCNMIRRQEYRENEFITVGRNEKDRWTILPRLCYLSKSSLINF